MTDTENKQVEETQTETPEQQQQPPEAAEQATEQAKTNSNQVFHFENILMKRFVASFIDLVLVGVAATIITVPAMFVLPKSPINFASLFGFFVFAAASAAVLLKDMPYKMGDMLDGQTPGKKAMNIRVTDLNKNPISMEQSIKRNLIPASGFVIAAISQLINVIQIPFLTGMVGFFVILPLLAISFFANIFEIYKIYSAPQHRRWGDQLANTIVAWE